MARIGDMMTPVSISPCIKVCKLNQSSICTGCGRLLSEIAAWSQMTIEEQREVCEQAAKRLSENNPIAPPTRGP